MIKKHFSSHFLIICLLVISFVLRVYKTNSIPVGTYIDETAIGLDAYMIGKTGNDMHGNSPFVPIMYSYGDYKLPLYIWLTVPWVMFFGKTLLAIRMVSIIAGCLSVFLIYLISLQLFSGHKKKKLIAIFSALFLSFLPWSILFSRTGFEGHLAQMFLLLMVFLILKSKKRKMIIIPALMSGVCAMYTYFSARFVIPFVFLVTLMTSSGIDFSTLQKKYKAFISQGVFALLVFALAFIPMLTSPLYAQSQQLRLSSKNVFQNQEAYVLQSNALILEDHNAWWSKLIHHRFVYLIKSVAKNYVEHISISYLFFSGDTNLRHSTQQAGILLLGSFPFLISGLYVLFKKYRSILFFLVIWWFVSILPAAIPTEVPHALRSINALGIFPLVLGIGATEMYVWSKRNKHICNVFFLCLFVCIVSALVFLFDYFTNYPKRSATAWSDGYMQMSQMIGTKREMYDHVYIVGGQKPILWTLYYGRFSPKEVLECVKSADKGGFDVVECLNLSFNMPDWYKKANEGAGSFLVVGDDDSTTGVLKHIQKEDINGVFVRGLYASYIRQK